MRDYSQLYRELSGRIKDNSASVLNRYRDDAFAKFEQKGFPSKKSETYLNSSIVDALNAEYKIDVDRPAAAIDEKGLFRCKIPSINAVLGFMLNDRFYIADDQRQSLPEGVEFCALSDAERLYPEVVGRYLHTLSDRSPDALTAFNSTFVQDGYFIYVKKGTIAQRPLQLINMSLSPTPLISFTHNLIVVEQGASLQLLVCDHAEEGVDLFASKVTEVVVEDGAQFEYYSLENTTRKTNNMMQMFVSQRDSSQVAVNNLLLLNSVSRNQITADIDGEHASLFLGGMLITDGKQEAENNTVVRHNKPNSTSNELFKYILDEQSHGIFSGIIVVQPDAQKTLSRQTNKSICLTPEAVVNSRPQLEIYADDVKCGHGATTGQLDQEALFYMKQRGIDHDTARMMLLSAFVQDVVDEIHLDVLREKMKDMIDRRLRNDHSHCEDCFVH